MQDMNQRCVVRAPQIESISQDALYHATLPMFAPGTDTRAAIKIPDAPASVLRNGLPMFRILQSELISPSKLTTPTITAHRQRSAIIVTQDTTPIRDVISAVLHTFRIHHVGNYV